MEYYGSIAPWPSRTLRATAYIERISSYEDVSALWVEVKKADPEKVHQFNNESVTAFYDRYLQEVSAWIEAGKAFVDAEIVM